MVITTRHDSCFGHDIKNTINIEEHYIGDEDYKQLIMGSVSIDYETRDDWTAYIERVEQYFLANNVADDKMVPVLLTVIGGKTYSLLRTLTFPDKPSTKSFGQIVAILKGHLSPKPLLIEERFRFHKQDQRDDENINTYVAEIKKLSEH